MKLPARSAIIGAVFLTVLAGVPAQARWGQGSVDTWVAAGDLTVGRGEDPTDLSS